MAVCDLPATHEEQRVDLFVYFKVIDGPPDRERQYDILNDVSRTLGHEVQHVELQMPNNYVYMASAVNNRVVHVLNRGHHSEITNESYWIAYKITISEAEQRKIAQYLEKVKGNRYSMADLFWAYFSCCMCPRTYEMDRFTCTSLCYSALTHSASFAHVLSCVSPEYARARNVNDWSVFVRNPHDLKIILDRMSAVCADHKDNMLRGMVRPYTVHVSTNAQSSARNRRRTSRTATPRLTIMSYGSDSSDSDWSE